MGYKFTLPDWRHHAALHESVHDERVSDGEVSSLVMT